MPGELYKRAEKLCNRIFSLDLPMSEAQITAAVVEVMEAVRDEERERLAEAISAEAIHHGKLVAHVKRREKARMAAVSSGLHMAVEIVREHARKEQSHG